MDKLEVTITENAEETKELGKKLANNVMRKGSENPPHIFCLYGDLGMGKTTFVQGFAQELGITTRLLSPTFIIVRRHILHATGRCLYHLDLYRLANEKSLEDLGIQEIFEGQQHIVVVEWAERLGSFLPKSRVDIRFNKGNTDVERRIEITYV
jgi:tRNA threonylcarbamoyladenosine biosynthesis protein TsaE